MDAPYSGNLRIWSGPDQAEIDEGLPQARTSTLASPFCLSSFTDQLYACESLNPPPSRPNIMENAEPNTLQWFMNIENHRYSRHGRWIPKLLEFGKHSGETLLGLGNGLGTDWLQYAREGAAVVVCSPDADQLALVRRNFELRSVPGRFLHARATSLPIENSAIDVVCVSSILHEMSDPQPVIEEIYRVLKPGGKVLAVAPAKYDVDYWYFTCFPWLRMFVRKKESPDDPAVLYSRRRLRKLFSRFVEPRIHKRQLRRADIPHLWRWVPRPLMERMMGKVLILKAFKPLSAALSVQMAA